MNNVYQSELVTLFHGDVLDLSAKHISTRPRILLTDPPYARAGAIATGRSSANGRHSDVGGADQFWKHWFRSVVSSIVAVMDPSGCGLVFTDYRTAHLVESSFAASGCGWVMSQCLVWDRDSMGLGDPFRASHELIAFVRGPNFKWQGRRDIRNVVRHRWPYGAHEHHPAEKPVALLRLLIDELSHRPEDVVFDPFAGSGSSLVASASAGRPVVGVEIDASFCDVAVSRLRANEGQAKLFGGTGT